MSASSQKSSVVRIVLVGALYFAIGFGFAALDPSVSARMRFLWRLSAWVLSAGTFATHIGFEHFRLDNSARVVALHTALSVAVGAMLLAAAATVHKIIVPSRTPYSRFLLALVLWPIITAVPAFVVSLVVAAFLSRIPGNRLAD